MLLSPISASARNTFLVNFVLLETDDIAKLAGADQSEFFGYNIDPKTIVISNLHQLTSVIEEVKHWIQLNTNLHKF